MVDRPQWVQVVVDSIGFHVAVEDLAVHPLRDRC